MNKGEEQIQEVRRRVKAQLPRIIFLLNETPKADIDALIKSLDAAIRKTNEVVREAWRSINGGGHEKKQSESVVEP